MEFYSIKIISREWEKRPPRIDNYGYIYQNLISIYEINSIMTHRIDDHYIKEARRSKKYVKELIKGIFTGFKYVILPLILVWWILEKNKYINVWSASLILVITPILIIFCIAINTANFNFRKRIMWSQIVKDRGPDIVDIYNGSSYDPKLATRKSRDYIYWTSDEREWKDFIGKLRPAPE